MKNNTVKLILDIFYTLNGQSRSIYDELPFEDGAIMIIKKKGEYMSTKRGYRERFHGLKEQEIYKEKFKEQEKSVEHLLSELKADIVKKLPAWSNGGDGYEVSYNKEETKELKNVVSSSFNIFKKPLTDTIVIHSLPESAKPGLENAFIKLGKTFLKKRIIEEVKAGAILNGEYKHLLEFDSVANACQYFLGKEKLEDAIANIKERIKERALIYEKDEILEDWSVINTRINAWVDHERKKYG